MRKPSGSKAELQVHMCLFPWSMLDFGLRELDRQTAHAIPTHLAAAGFEIISA